MPEPLHLWHGTLSKYFSGFARNMVPLYGRISSFFWPRSISTIPFSQSGQIILKFSLHEFRYLDAEFVQLGIELLPNLSAASNEELNRMPSMRVEAY